MRDNNNNMLDFRVDDVFSRLLFNNLLIDKIY